MKQIGRGSSGGRGRQSINCHCGCHKRRSCESVNAGMVLCVVGEIDAVQWERSGSLDLGRAAGRVGSGARRRLDGIDRVMMPLRVMVDGVSRSGERRV